MKLNLDATTKEQELIKAYLEKNASEILAEKINKGTPFEKDGKIFINRKTLDGFMKYASDEARKLASKGANSACVEDKVVYGWAIHYFEENSIEGTLYNEDGTECKPAPKPAPAKIKKTEAKKQDSRQASLFDFLEPQQPEPKAKDDDGDDEDDQPSHEEIDEILAELAEEEAKAEVKPQKPVSPIWQRYQDLQKKYPDCIILYRLGDFYEVFGDNAVTLSNELGLTLTGRDVGLESRVPMIGFPYHVADSYIKRIIRTHKIAIAETNGNVTTLPEHEDDIEELTEAEMRQFDGDIEEPDLADDEPAFDTSAFDKTALCKLDEIFGNKLSVR